MKKNYTLCKKFIKNHHNKILTGIHVSSVNNSLLKLKHNF